MAEWTIEDVAARFAEAVETARKLPPVRPGGYFNPWMTLAFPMSDRYPDREKLYWPVPPSPQAVERMLETMRWVQWLEVEQRHMVWMRANRYEWQQIGRRFGCDRNTAARRWKKAISVVLLHLSHLQH